MKKSGTGTYTIKKNMHEKNWGISHRKKIQYIKEIMHEINWSKDTICLSLCDS